MPRIDGISKHTLWESWKNIRKQLSRTFLRDVADFVEYDVDPDWWIRDCSRRLRLGSTSRHCPPFHRCKEDGIQPTNDSAEHSRLVIYRAVVDQLYGKQNATSITRVFRAEHFVKKGQGT